MAFHNLMKRALVCNDLVIVGFCSKHISVSFAVIPVEVEVAAYFTSFKIFSICIVFINSLHSKPSRLKLFFALFSLR